MNLKFASIIDLNEAAWPGKTSSIVYLSGCPLQCYWCNVPFLVNPKEGEFDSKPTSFFVEHFNKLQANTDAVVFMGGEPFMQSNALLELCKGLKHMGFKTRVETSGYYANELRDLLPYLDYVSMDVKVPLEEEGCAKTTAFKGDAKILLSKLLSSMAFLESAKGKGTFIEMRTTVIPGLNDSIEAIQKICEDCRTADLYALQQFSPGGKGSFVDWEYENAAFPSKEKMYELAYAAKKTFQTVLIRYIDGTEEMV
ncbi:TPA: 4Fe-4S cluster-binding domain-containing protein [Candidatus Micrarchaeota archaeon]|nr:4Fe-4S cluster-binding domain-containing protein [Candidatus Micrarchaeota archaeon]